ncbi:hypothetical protein M0R45_018402 [Rubus argutus]|uniref:Acyl-[acyl-carrier-protein] hydrolase n=1 Tax=Rubus argutus TaxID=59490 RepID=A0AAW1X3D0_RUBAR
MLHAFAAPTFFMLRLQPTFPCSNKPTCSRGKGNSNSAHATMVHGKEDIEVAAKKMPYQHLNMESARNIDGVYDSFGGKLSHDGRVLKQNFAIRSYELGPDGKASLGSLMKRLQETSVQHCKSVGIFSSGFGSTREMDRRGLVWVTRKLQIDVENYPTWDDVIQIDTWTCASGDNGWFRDWVFRDYRTGEILIQASGLYVLMNIQTRRLSKFLPEIKDEMECLLKVTDPVIDITKIKLRQLDVNTKNHVRTGLSPAWTDLDVNRHVKNVKYLDWVLESIPLSVLKNHQVSSIVLEFRKECRMDDMLQSLSSAARTLGQSTGNEEIEFDHLLRLEDGSAILRGKSVWKPSELMEARPVKITATNVCI